MLKSQTDVVLVTKQRPLRDDSALFSKPTVDKSGTLSAVKSATGTAALPTSVVVQMPQSSLVSWNVRVFCGAGICKTRTATPGNHPSSIGYLPGHFTALTRFHSVERVVLLCTECGSIHPARAVTPHVRAPADNVGGGATVFGPDGSDLGHERTSPSPCFLCRGEADQSRSASVSDSYHFRQRQFPLHTDQDRPSLSPLTRQVFTKSTKATLLFYRRASGKR